jgi:hypothetical protein
MDDELKRARRFWPTVFLTAFALGAVLWGVWMINIARKTRENRENTFFVPPPVQPATTNTNAAPAKGP